MPGPDHRGGLVGEVGDALHRVRQRGRHVTHLAVEDAQLAVGAGEHERAAVQLRPGEHLVRQPAALLGLAVAQHDADGQQLGAVGQLFVTEPLGPALGLRGGPGQGAEVRHRPALEVGEQRTEGRALVRDDGAGRRCRLRRH